ncbi:hypothetical protein EAG_07560 [Camponotus floridanus]|uniref:Uncharacterized protein n=1 Tax=Camponotus floridanus TaxID=104421 RepID=E2A443_CAMFO|nr:hypothetical protein EAG_07560 [Camponotus floridanus]
MIDDNLKQKLISANTQSVRKRYVVELIAWQPEVSTEAATLCHTAASDARGSRCLSQMSASNVIGEIITGVQAGSAWIFVISIDREEDADV